MDKTEFNNKVDVNQHLENDNNQVVRINFFLKYTEAELITSERNKKLMIRISTFNMISN